MEKPETEKNQMREMCARFVEDQIVTLNSLAPLNARNLAENYRPLVKLMNERDINLPVVDFHSAGRPAIVTASGPSLNDIIPHIDKMRKAMDAPIFSALQQLGHHLHHGVKPDYVVAIDPRECGWMYARHAEKDIADSVFITHPGIHNKVLTGMWSTFKKTGMMFRPVMMTSFERFEMDETFEEFAARLKDHSRWMGNIFRGHMEILRGPTTEALYGPSNPEIKFPLKTNMYSQPNATLAQMSCAYALGFNPIFLVGYDLGFRQGKVRMDTYVDGQLKEFSLPENAVPGYSFPTTYEMLDYKISTIMMARKVGPLDMVEVIPDDGPGNLELLPRMHYTELMKPWPKGQRPPKPSNEEMDEFFARHGLHVTVI